MFIKICGITSIADARMVAGSGAQAIGLNFFRESPRHVELSAAAEIVQSLPPFIEAVGVFVNMPPGEIRSIANPLGLRTVQLHGDVTPNVVAELRDFSVMPAFPLGNENDIARILSFIQTCQQIGRLPSALLIDASVDGKFGGTGQTAPWPVARKLVERCSLPVALAGGLTVKNVADAIKTVRPWGVDVASGVEVAPGRKEPYKVRSFIDAVRRA